MNVLNWLVWGFGATVVLTVVLAGSQALGLTRMNIPYLLGTMRTPDRDQATLVGAAMHVGNGLVLSLIYIAAFHAWGGATVWKGALIGIVHALFVLAVVLPALPGMHPRMASETAGPTVTRQLEPPGFFALHYGLPTPIWVVVAHAFFGGILGGFYRVM